MSARKGLVMVFLASVCFSVGGLLVKMIPWQGLSINSSRSFLSVLVLLVFAAVTRHKFRLTRGVLIGAAAVCGNTIFYIVANKHTTAANAILLEFTAPVFVILFSLLVFREKPRKLDILACVLVFGGIACFFLDGPAGEAGNFDPRELSGMLRMVSVKKLFFLLALAIVALLLVFFIHGPFLEPGVEEAVVRAVLAQAGEPEAGQLAAEGHKVFQAVEKGDELTVYGIFSYGLYDTEEGDYIPGAEAVPARITFGSIGSGGWELRSYEEAGIEGTAVWDLFPVSLRPFLLLSGLYDSGLEAQLRAYTE